MLSNPTEGLKKYSRPNDPMKVNDVTSSHATSNTLSTKSKADTRQALQSAAKGQHIQAMSDTRQGLHVAAPISHSAESKLLVWLDMSVTRQGLAVALAQQW